MLDQPSCISNKSRKRNYEAFFLSGQKTIKFEFDYSELTINGDPEKAFMEKEVVRLNKKKIGNGDTLLNKWQREKSIHAPQTFIDQFNNYFKQKKIPFEAVTASDKPDYVCVVKWIAIKTGTPNMISPTVRVVYLFYKNSNRNGPLAKLQSHIVYSKGGSRTDAKGMVLYTICASWVELYGATWKEAIKMAKKIRHDAKLRK